MDLGKLLQSLVERRRLLARVALGVMVLLVVADMLTPAHYTRFPWDGIGGFGALYGFVSCVLIIVVSKAFGHAFLERPEDYYDD